LGISKIEKFTVLIPYRHSEDELRLKALNELRSCISIQTEKNFEIIIVEQVFNNKIGFPDVGEISKHIPLQDPLNRAFNKSWLMNVGIKQASTNNILILDADISFGKDYFYRIFDFQKSHDYSFFNGYSWICLMPGRDNPYLRVSNHKGVTCVGGSWFTKKDYFFNELGGMNENYFGYGGEDYDMWARATFVLGEIPTMDYAIVHNYHHWENVGITCNDSFKTKYNVEEVLKRLKGKKLGNIQEPTLIKWEDLKGK